jgi:hypothetical protein
MTLQEMHERLLAWAGADTRKESLLAARQAYFAAFGEPNEEDKSFELRMNGLLDFYLFDFRDGRSRTALEQFVLDPENALAADESDRYRELSNNVHGLFEVRRIRPGELRVRDVFSGQDHDIVERRQVVGLAKGDLIEARLLPFEGRFWFSGAFLYHPQAVRKRILGEVKRLRKESGKNGSQPDVKAFLALLSRMAFKLERYRNVKIESIYDFTAVPEPKPRG